MTTDFSDTLDADYLEREITGEEIAEIVHAVKKRNPNHTDEKLFAARYWDVDRFQYEHLPVVVKSLEEPGRFSQRNEIRVLDMPLRMPDQGWRIPERFSQFEELFQTAIDYERVVNPFFDDCYVYITIDQKLVPPRDSQRRPGWHSDAYITDESGSQVDVTAENREHMERQESRGRRVDHTYVCYDATPTWFLPGPFPLDCDPRDCEAVLKTFDEIAAEELGERDPVTYPTYTVLRLDPYDIHAAAPNPRDVEIPRTFVKLQVSPERYNREGNTENPFFDYDWEMEPRETGKRNHRTGSGAT